MANMVHLRERIYLLFSHEREESDFLIECVTKDIDVLESHLEENFLDECFDRELLTSNKDIVCNWFGYDDDWMRVFSAYGLNVDIPRNKTLYALCANGYEMSWEGAIKGIFKSKVAVRNALMKILEEKHQFYDKDDKKDVKEQFDKTLMFCDCEYIYWQCVEFKIP